MTEWEAIEERFRRLRDFVLTDLEGFVTQKRGGNFGVVAVMLAACDALGTLRYGGRGSGPKVFARCLPKEWGPVATILYDALRHGLVHGYDPKIVVAKGARVGFAIGWFDEDPHMHFLTEDRTILYIAVPSLVRSLRETFAEVEQELRDSGDLRDQFFTRDRKGREMHLTSVEDEAWSEVVRRAPVYKGSEPRAMPAGATGPAGPLR